VVDSRRNRRAAAGPAAPPAPIVVRLATAADLDTLVRLRVALLREHAGSPMYGRLRTDIDARARALFAHQLAGPDEACFLAERGGRAIGCIRIVESAGSVLLLPARYGYLSSAYVVPDERRAGVLRLLTTHAISWCTARGLAEVRLHADAANAGAAGAWEALGFPIVEHLRHKVLTPR
jgi:ribosomal protein S18 acetylase RimI-like enzyme